MNGNPDDLLTSREVAAVLRCEYRKALRLIGDKIPAAMVEGQWRIRRADLAGYVDSVTVTDRHSKARRKGRGRRT